MKTDPRSKRPGGDRGRVRPVTLATLAAHTGAHLRGDPEAQITGLAPLDRAGPGQLSHLSSPAWRKYLQSSQATAVIVSDADADDTPGAALITANPYLAYARASGLFDLTPAPPAGVSEQAWVHPDARLDADVSVGPGAVIEAGAHIGAGSQVDANAVIGQHAVTGRRCRIHANAVICHRVRLGDDCRVHSGAVIGADGFGFAANEQGQHEAIAQLGSVVLGDRVEVGACSTIDRGALDDTRVDDGVKIDNQVQVGHNCHIGHDSILCGCVALAGGCVIGARCVLGGDVKIGGGEIELAPGTMVAASSTVTRSIRKSGVYGSGLTIPQAAPQWRRAAVYFTKLGDLFTRVQRMDRRLAALEKSRNRAATEPRDET